MIIMAREGLLLRCCGLFHFALGLGKDVTRSPAPGLGRAGSHEIIHLMIYCQDEDGHNSKMITDWHNNTMYVDKNIIMHFYAFIYVIILSHHH